MDGTTGILQENVLFVVKRNYKTNFPKPNGGKPVLNAATVFHDLFLLLPAFFLLVRQMVYYFVRITARRRVDIV